MDNYTEDIKNTNIYNYQYDKIGNLVKDASADISNIDWTVYGKIKKIQKTGNSINYTYDPAGNRQSKQIVNSAGSNTTYYVRDAQGNTLANYTIYNGSTIVWDEQYLYGSNRLGMWKPNIAITESGGGTGTGAWKLAGLKQYELTNHLGNVMVTISDKRKLVGGFYEPEMLSVQVSPNRAAFSL